MGDKLEIIMISLCDYVQPFLVSNLLRASAIATMGVPS